MMCEHVWVQRFSWNWCDMRSFSSGGRVTTLLVISNYKNREPSWGHRVVLHSEASFFPNKQSWSFICFDICNVFTLFMPTFYELIKIKNSLKYNNTIPPSSLTERLTYLHDDEEDQGDEDVDLRVFPGLGVSDVVKLLGNALFGPRPVVQ